MNVVNITTTRDVCCGQNQFIGSHEFCFGPCGAGDGWIGKCVVCQKEWEIDSSCISNVTETWREIEVDTNKISCDLTVGDLVFILSRFDFHTPIDSIRLKGSSNLVFASSNSDGVNICD
ncbi:hypothetical protein UGMREWDR_CDS0194 [Aeromonas phage GomatiRiver_11]|nr:hypothetical protein OBDJBBDK_00189 [Aeromonas phage AhFM11]WKW84361.1 hypothetical protein UGMREWDR_CDS0194 [Aeromonas phage GomatiRiver_11]